MWKEHYEEALLYFKQKKTVLKGSGLFKVIYNRESDRIQSLSHFLGFLLDDIFKCHLYAFVFTIKQFEFV